MDPDGQKQPLPSKATRQVEAGTRIVLKTAGGGGFGDPLERSPERVARDVREGFVSPARAREAYAVVVDGAGRLDAEATEKLRDGTTHRQGE